VSAWCWLALVEDGAPRGADAAAEVSEPDGRRAGWLAAWRRRAKPRRDALRVDARIVDPAGSEAFASLVRAPAGVRVLFDDLAVQHARRELLAGPPPALVTTMLRDASHFEGALTARRGPHAQALLRDDPFARVLPRRLLRVGRGLLGAVAAPAGPVIERYGSAQPWPWDRFPAADPR
jgi:hypothetical protein